jgi:putative Mg2+ transporter-C (MgtC) family protein
MTTELAHISVQLLAAVFAGAVIGFERSFHGRPAGFRTHALVCTASSLLMLVTLYQWRWFSPGALERIAVDPTRMAQGIMTGIGFLGAGVIMKEGLSVRGLTTAASIWMTAAIGILIGVGFWFPAVLGVVLTLGMLSGFRRIEMVMPTQYYAHLSVRFPRSMIMTETELRALIAEHEFSIANLSYRLVADGQSFEYRMMIRTLQRTNPGRLAVTLTQRPDVLEFRISPTGD